jgi:hypothetical protein
MTQLHNITKSQKNSRKDAKPQRHRKENPLRNLYISATLRAAFSFNREK